MKTKIKIKFKKPIGILTPHGGILSPKIYPNIKVDTPLGTASVHDYNFNEEYVIDLLEEDKEMPPHVTKLGKEVREAFLIAFAKELAENHTANQEYRKTLKHYEDSGIITVLSDSFLDPQLVKDAEVEEKAKDNVVKAAEKLVEDDHKESDEKKAHPPSKAEKAKSDKA